MDKDSPLTPEGNMFDVDSHSIKPDIIDMFPGMENWTMPSDVKHKHKDKPDKILPPAVCENGQHTGNPHCPVVETPDLPSPVPLPGAAWLFISAVVALVIAKRR